MTRRWIAVVAISAVACTALELAVLQVKYRVFTGGFLMPTYVTGWSIPVFLAGSLLLDAAVAVLLCAPALWIADRFGRGRRATFVLAAILCALVLQTGMIVRIQGAGMLGDVLKYRFLPGSELNSVVLGIAALLLVGAAGGAVAVYLARLIPARVATWLDQPQSRRRGVLYGVAVVIAGCVLVVVASAGLFIQFKKKTSGLWIYRTLDGASDFDGDTWGLVSRPRDHAPFDSIRHPYAVDLPANGIDENGVHGDLDRPGDFSGETYDAVKFARRPDVVVFVLESFRADNLEAEVDGKPVAPTLRKLVADGALHGPAYSHTGFTSPSLTQLFTGRISMLPGSTLIDDFNANGYLTACFSGEDESFSGIEEQTGMARLDHFVDARNDVARRAFPSARAASLVVGWKVVVERIEEFLESHGRKPQQVFAYVNLQDCHFPYHHAGLDPLLVDDPVSRGAIRKDNAVRVLRTYRNAARNVDGAVGRILDSWTRARGRRPAFVILADHGESLFEDDGVLGHGLALRPEQTRIPFLVGGLDVECVFPVGHADVRALLRRALATPIATPAARIDPDKWVFQCIGSLNAPYAVGAAFAQGGHVFLFPKESNSTWGDPPAQGPDVVRHWERIKLHRHEQMPR